MESRAFSVLTHILLYQSGRAEFHFAIVLRGMLEQIGSSFSEYKYGEIEMLPGLPGECPLGHRSLGVTSWVASSLEVAYIGARDVHVK